MTPCTPTMNQLPSQTLITNTTVFYRLRLSDNDLRNKEFQHQS
ncbi:hypothetical protein Hanom_Chr01g00020441 [Helianthus anomalus]